MFILIFFVHYLLLKTFLLELYVVYFISFTILVYIFRQSKVEKPIFIFSLCLIILSPFLFEYLDNYIYNLHLFLDYNEQYSFVGGEVTYVLSLLHSIVFFLSYNRKKYL